MTDLLLFWPWYSSRLQTPVRTGEGLVFRIADGPDLSSRGIPICCNLGYPRLVVHPIRQSFITTETRLKSGGLYYTGL